MSPIILAGTHKVTGPTLPGSTAGWSHRPGGAESSPCSTLGHRMAASESYHCASLRRTPGPASCPECRRPTDGRGHTRRRTCRRARRAAPWWRGWSSAASMRRRPSWSVFDVDCDADIILGRYDWPGCARTTSPFSTTQTRSAFAPSAAARRPAASAST